MGYSRGLIEEIGILFASLANYLIKNRSENASLINYLIGGRVRDRVRPCLRLAKASRVRAAPLNRVDDGC